MDVLELKGNITIESPQAEATLKRVDNLLKDQAASAGQAANEISNSMTQVEQAFTGVATAAAKIPAAAGQLDQEAAEMCDGLDKWLAAMELARD